MVLKGWKVGMKKNIKKYVCAMLISCNSIVLFSSIQEPTLLDFADLLERVAHVIKLDRLSYEPKKIIFTKSRDAKDNLLRACCQHDNSSVSAKSAVADLNKSRKLWMTGLQDPGVFSFSRLPRKGVDRIDCCTCKPIDNKGLVKSALDEVALVKYRLSHLEQHVERPYVDLLPKKVIKEVKKIPYKKPIYARSALCDAQKSLELCGALENAGGVFGDSKQLQAVEITSFPDKKTVIDPLVIERVISVDEPEESEVVKEVSRQSMDKQNIFLVQEQKEGWYKQLKRKVVNRFKQTALSKWLAKRKIKSVFAIDSDPLGVLVQDAYLETVFYTLSMVEQQQLLDNLARRKIERFVSKREKAQKVKRYRKRKVRSYRKMRL